MKRLACKYNFFDSLLALNGAFFVNAAILVLSAARFWPNRVETLQQAHELLHNVWMPALASGLFAVALLWPVVRQTPPELRDALKLVEACPNTRFILDHCGNGPVFTKDRGQWQKDMAALAQRKNVVGKVSGIVAQCTPGKWTANDLAPVVNHTLEVFGPERVMFAGDWPVCTLGATYRQWVEALRQIVRQRPAAQQRRLFHDNAVAYYGLK